MLVTRGLGRGGSSQGTLNTFGLGIDGDLPGGGKSKYHRKKIRLPKKKLKLEIADDVPQVEQESVFKMQARRIESQIKAVEAQQSAEKKVAINTSAINEIAVASAKQNLAISDEEAALLMLMLAID